MENEIGVTRRRVSIFELDEAAFLQEATPLQTPDATPETTEPPTSGPTRLLRTAKALSVWPLPGGRRAWKATLDAMADHVAAEAPTVQQAITWLITTYEKASSEKVARGYWQVPRSFGLIDLNGEQLTLTVEGAEYHDEPTTNHLLALMRRHAAGFDEILSHLADRSCTTEELLQHQRNDLGVTWETDAQIRFRMGWLENVGVVREDNGHWRLADATGPAPESS